MTEVCVFDTYTSDTVHGSICVDPARPGVLSRGDWVAAVGKALGLGTAALSVDSVMNTERPQPRAAPTGRDLESFCRLYGRPTFCGD